MAAYTMSLDWIPGVAVGLAGSLISFILASSRGAAVIETKLQDFKEQMEERFQHAKETASFQAKENESRNGNLGQEIRELTSEVREGLAKIQGIAVQIAALSAEQMAVNRIVTKTLEGVLQRLDNHDERLQEHSVEIAALREFMKRSATEG